MTCPLTTPLLTSTVGTGMSRVMKSLILCPRLLASRPLPRCAQMGAKTSLP
ncbi:hypothetical protein MBAV_000659 [Candidatus Magnetobacterium bavaricum]|uniref:Uncharacterized protein n=1 Tax=Candidatus Magnetobacterium bavaricum TaxID=29290 RepID=A0A0F3GZ74_9BACT|nr:hypothetical protein MBAV_000659 [Candidatus Magnetobacterium bavaricum]